MPHYDNECGACGEIWETWQQIVDKPVKRCPSCGSRKVKRLIGAGSCIIFKGPGWQTNHRLDYEKQFVVSPQKGAKAE